MFAIDHAAFEEQARGERKCRGCGKEKPSGCVVCWDCFGHRQDVVPLKFFNGEFHDWLRTLPVFFSPE